MSRGLNKVFLIGNLGRDPESRQTNSGTAVVTLSVATPTAKKENGEWIDVPEWHRVVLFERQAEVAAQYLKKGSQVHIEGSLRTSKWQDNQGNDRWSTEVRCWNLILLGSKESGEVQPQDPAPKSVPAPAPAPRPTPAAATADDQLNDDIPF